MPTMVVLVETGAEIMASLDAAAIDVLSDLGVTSLALVRDERSVGIVLEGWAFDPGASAEAALDILARDRGRARALHPVAEMLVTATPRHEVSARRIGEAS